MAKQLLLTDIEPDKYYLIRRNVHGLGNTLWPCKVVCKDTHGWMRGYVEISNDGRAAWVIPLGSTNEYQINIRKGHGCIYTEELFVNTSDNFAYNEIHNLETQIETLTKTLNALKSISPGELACHNVKQSPKE